MIRKQKNCEIVSHVSVQHIAMSLNLTRHDSIAQRRRAVGEPTVMRTRQEVDKDKCEQPA
jgi:hypothetical protein